MSARSDEDLETAQRLAREGQENIARQKDIIAELEQDGTDASRAREMLTIFIDTQRAHESYLARLVAAHGAPTAPDAADQTGR